MLNINQLLGQSGEAVAVRYLKKKRYKILELNYRNRLGEIDIIALDKETIVFIEVKTRKGFSFGSPKEAITKQKQNNISRVALSWLKSKKKSNTKARFDVVSIVSKNLKHSNKTKLELFFQKNKQMDIELTKNAFELNFG